MTVQIPALFLYMPAIHTDFITRPSPGICKDKTNQVIMKILNHLTVLALCASLLLPACDDYDDTALWQQVNDNTGRIEALEAWQNQMNNNIAAIQQLLNTQDYITSVTPVVLSGETVGYTIEFAKSPSITIYNGEKGDKGDTPQIGITQESDGNWYWTLNGELMLDPQGNPIRANGEKGDKGEPGERRKKHQSKGDRNKENQTQPVVNKRFCSYLPLQPNSRERQDNARFPLPSHYLFRHLPEA